MSISAFPDKNCPPTMAEVYAVLGSKRPLWERLERYLAENTRYTGELKHYGKSYGWMVWYRRSGKTLVSLYPQQEGLTVQIVLTLAQVERAQALDLAEAARRTLEDTPQLRDGRWLFIPVSSQRDVEDVERLVDIKLSVISIQWSVTGDQ